MHSLRVGHAYLSASYDHKAIGIQYGVTSLIVLLLAGLFALIFRTQLALNQDILGLRNYNTIMTLHGIVMIGGILLGVGAISNYLVPLMIGANDMAFPRLNAFAFWINVPAVIILLSSLLLGGLETGWTGYPPLSTRAPLGTNMFLLGVYFIGLSSILGSLNIITSVIRMRAKGMTYFRMPILVWAALATALIGLTATQLIGLSFQMVLFERIFGMSFFEGQGGGNPVLFQHLFWFYSHPGSVRVCAGGSGNNQRDITGICTQTLVRLPVGCSFFLWNCHRWLSGLGSSYVHFRHGALPASAIHVYNFISCYSDRSKVF